MSVNRNHWSAKEVEILLHYGADVAATKLGRSLIGCMAKERSLKDDGSKGKKNNRYEFEDKIRILTNSNAFVKQYYNLTDQVVKNTRYIIKKELKNLSSTDPSKHLKYLTAIDKEGGLWKCGKKHNVERDITTARYQKNKDKLTFIHEDRVSSAEELSQGLNMGVEILNHNFDTIIEGNINYPDRVPSPNKPEEAPSFLKRIWETVSNW